MAFPKRYAEVAARLRVPAGFLVVLAFLGLARPTWDSLVAGAAVATLGMLLRAWAAGHLEKNLRLTTSGPFAHSRNPLYLGSLISGAGLAIAGRHLPAGIFILAFFVFFYLPVVEEEERHLRSLFPDYRKYEAQVPKYWPKLTAQSGGGRFQWSLYLRNREYQALAGFLVTIGLLAAKAAFQQ